MFIKLTASDTEVRAAGVGARIHSSQAQPERLEWIDLVKSISVLLVVLMHFVMTLVEVVDSPVTGFWEAAVNVLEPMRMPTFFVVSGIIAADAVDRPWRSSRRRTLGLPYLYVVWFGILFVTLQVATWSAPSSGTVVSFLAGLLVPYHGYWFLYALVLYFVIAKLTRNLPVWIVIGIPLVVSLFRAETIGAIRTVLAFAGFDDARMTPWVVLNLVFFLIGVRYKTLVLTVARNARWTLIVVLGITATALTLVRHWQPIQWENAFILLAALWIVTAVMLASLLVAWEGPRSMSAYVGRRTLPIYVVQFPFVMLASIWFAESPPTVLETAWGQVLYPPVATAAIAAIGLGLYAAVQGNVFRHLFTAPDWIISPRLPRPRTNRTTDGSVAPDQSRGVG